MIFNCPLGTRKANQIINSLSLSSNDRVVDVGCGTGEFLIRLVEKKCVQGYGVDQNLESIISARKSSLDRIPGSSCEFRAARIQEISLDDSSFELAICMGSTHAYGCGNAAYSNTIREFVRIVKPGGLMLIGEGYWKQEPPREYLELIGTPVGIYRNHLENVTFAEAQGLVTLCALVSSEDEWDHFEWSHQQRTEQEFASSPENPELVQKLKHRREWMKGYLRWGRATMGFGFYLFQKPAKDITTP